MHKLPDLAFFILLSLAVQAQSPGDSLFGEACKKQAVRFLQAGQSDSAAWYAGQAEQTFRRLDDLENWIHLHRKLGQAYRDNGQYELAVGRFRHALDRGWRRPIQKKEHIQRAWAYADIGYVGKRRNDQKTVVEYYEKAAAVFLDTLGMEDALVARYVYSELGNALNRLRDYAKAEFYLKQCVNILRRESNPNAAAGALNDLGMVYLNREDFPRAIAAFSQGLDLGGIDADYSVLLLYNIGLAYLYNQDYEKALGYTRRCETVLRHSGFSSEETGLHLMELYDNYSKIYRARGDFSKAEKYCTLALQTAASGSAVNPRTVILARIARGNLYLDWRKPRQALGDFDAALSGLMPPDAARLPGHLPDPSVLRPDPFIVDILGGMARCYIMLNQTSASADYVQRAQRAYQIADNVATELLFSYVLEESRLTAQTEHRWITSDQISFLFDVWEANPAAPDLLEKMFACSERSRAFLLWQGMEMGKLFRSDSLQALRAQYDDFNRQIEALELALAYPPGDAEKQQLEAAARRLLKQKEKKAALVRRAVALAPHTGLAKQHTPAPLAVVQKQLKPGEALLEFFIGEQDAYVLVLAVLPNALMVKKIEWDEGLSKIAETIRDDISAQHNAAYIWKARRLYDQLLKPVLDHIPARHLTLVPDGVLWNVPFAALLTRDIPPKGSADFKSFPYLLRERTIAYGFSATLQAEMSKPYSRVERGISLAFAPAYRKIDPNLPDTVLYALRRNRLDTLLYNLPEAMAVARMQGMECIGGASATRKRFLELLPRARLLHIAAHAKANHQNSDFSFIAFSNMGDTLAEPFQCYLNELYHQNIPAEMVVLSACETAAGPVRQGEGTLSLARAFACAGAHSILTTLWSIDDKAGKDIMVAYYQYLKNDMAKHQALRQAQLDYLQNAADHDRAHPYYWAAFTVLGNTEPLRLPFPTTIVLATLAIVAFAGFFWLYGKQRLFGKQ
ncbi:MAG: CHAT domain-containing protein [Saprospirales bacterium]|nr:CHAT domain-containing protein [Saprospirales bacterium]